MFTLPNPSVALDLLKCPANTLTLELSSVMYMGICDLRTLLRGDRRIALLKRNLV